MPTNPDPTTNGGINGFEPLSLGLGPLFPGSIDDITDRIRELQAEIDRLNEFLDKLKDSSNDGS